MDLFSNQVEQISGTTTTWSDDKAVLVVEGVRRHDAGIYKCRADFKKSPTKNSRFVLSIQGTYHLEFIDSRIICRDEHPIVVAADITFHSYPLCIMGPRSR